MFIPPPILLLVAIGISFLAAKMAPGLELAGDGLPVIGITLIGVGIALIIWAVQFFRRYKTTIHPRGKPTALITTGPYKISRNPIYLGFLLIALGTAMLFANVLAFVGPVIFFFFIQTLVIPFEEDMLVKTFGDSYQKYRKLIRRWL